MSSNISFKASEGKTSTKNNVSFYDSFFAIVMRSFKLNLINSAFNKLIEFVRLQRLKENIIIQRIIEFRENSAIKIQRAYRDYVRYFNLHKYCNKSKSSYFISLSKNDYDKVYINVGCKTCFNPFK